jgi:hypothetical protein
VDVRAIASGSVLGIPSPPAGLAATPTSAQSVAAGLVRRDVARRILEHRRRRGDVPAGWARWADDVLEPVVDWRSELAAAVCRGLRDTVTELLSLAGVDCPPPRGVGGGHGDQPRR